MCVNNFQGKQRIPTLDGVSVFYSSNENRLVSTHSEGPIQLTNSQKIRRSATLQVTSSLRRTRTVLSIDIVDMDGVGHIPSFPTILPFARLVRSKTLEDAKFKQSLVQLHTIRAMMEDAAMPKYEFRGGRCQHTSRDVMLQNAFPVLRCGFCPRVFSGADRKRKLARHRKKLHRFRSSPEENESDRQITAAPAESDVTELPMRSARVVSIDEFLLVHEERMPSWEAWALPPGGGTSHGGDTTFEDEVNTHTALSQSVKFHTTYSRKEACRRQMIRHR